MRSPIYKSERPSPPGRGAVIFAEQEPTFVLNVSFVNSDGEDIPRGSILDSRSDATIELTRELLAGLIPDEYSTSINSHNQKKVITANWFHEYLNGYISIHNERAIYSYGHHLDRVKLESYAINESFWINIGASGFRLKFELKRL